MEIRNVVFKNECNPRKKVERILQEFRIYTEKKKLNQSTSTPLNNACDSEKDIFFDRVEKALLALNEEERLLIQYRYLENGGNTFDYIVKDRLGLSERTYYRLKRSALFHLHELIY